MSYASNCNRKFIQTCAYLDQLGIGHYACEADYIYVNERVTQTGFQIHVQLKFD